MHVILTTPKKPNLNKVSEYLRLTIVLYEFYCIDYLFIKYLLSTHYVPDHWNTMN